jgi:hypothetical protein
VYSNRSKSVGVKRNLVGQKVLQINVWWFVYIKCWW